LACSNSPPHLAGNYAPVTEELTAHDVPVTGRVPDRVTGWYLRNGPNPHDAASGHWFFGDGMIHGVRLGRADRPRPARVPYGFHGNWLADL
jgi:carotenoid cleavage dioxygenase